MIQAKILDVYFQENHLLIYKQHKYNPKCTQKLSYELASSGKDAVNFIDRKTSCILIWLN
jgi:hypothetical protein